MKLAIWIIATLAAAWISSPLCAQDIEPEPAPPVLLDIKPALLGDKDDGSLALPVHLIPLLDEEQADVYPEDDPAIPFSVKETCAYKCHSYNAITAGWHFNANDPSVDPGRPGHPWLFVDRASGTQIPLSRRNWEGAFHPGDIGITDWQFAQRFARQMPGGGALEWTDSEDAQETIRMMVSGNLEANCLACHDSNPAHNQTEYAEQIKQENFRWAAAATSGFTSVEGSAKQMDDTFDYLMPDPPRDPKKIPPSTHYSLSALDHKNRVFFEIDRKVKNERCYFCHSTQLASDAMQESWAQDEDAHIAAGMKCVDCHRNGLDHNIVRGYENESEHSSNPAAEALSCEGCHLGVEGAAIPTRGRMAAPVPEHKGIPVIHFEKMTCTACHSGPWPQKNTQRAKTAFAHALGTHGANPSPSALPHIQTPVFARNANGKIAPHHLVWPSYWGALQDHEIKPVAISAFQSIASGITQSVTKDDNGWLPLSEAMIQAILTSLQETLDETQTAVYVTGGHLLSLSESEPVKSELHPLARPYLWPIAHNVRPAAQSTGVRSCEDCHSKGSNYFFAKIESDSPSATLRGKSISMHTLQDVDKYYIESLAQTFPMRPWLRYTGFAAAGLLILILIAAASQGLLMLMKCIAKQKNEYR